MLAGDLLGTATSRGAVPGRSFRPHEFRVVRHAGRSVSRPVATVYVYPAKNGTKHGRLARVRFPDGKTLNYREVR